MLQKPNTSKAQVFRIRFVAEAQPSAGELVIRDAEAPVLPEATWNVRCEPLDGPDTFLQEILEHVRSGASLTVEGIAGTGKTVALRAVQAALEEAGVKCQAICLTHTHTHWRAQHWAWSLHSAQLCNAPCAIRDVGRASCAD